MKVNLETKFNIGDVVYVAETYEVCYANKTPYTITDIIVRLDEDTIKIVYNLHQNYTTTTVSENFLFATYEECVQWCKEHI